MQSDDELFVSPVVVVTKAFPARPGSLPDAQEFVLESIELAEVETAEGHALYVAITDAILAAAGPDEGTFTVTVRLFPDGAEVEVLHGSDGRLPQGSVGGVSFASWFSETLRRQGLSQQEAARQVGVSVRTVSRWVLGQTEPRMRDLRRVRQVFGEPLT